VTRNRARSDLTSQPRFIEPVDEPSHLTVLYQVPEGVTLGFPNRQRADSYVDAPFGKAFVSECVIGCFHMSGLFVRPRFLAAGPDGNPPMRSLIKLSRC
jgi:hypothetical protein